MAQEKHGNSLLVGVKPMEWHHGARVLPTKQPQNGTVPSEPLRQPRLRAEECGTECCCLRPGASAHFLIHHSSATSDLLPRVFFLFQSKREEDSPPDRVYVRPASSSSKVSESIWALRCCASRRSTHWGFAMDSMYRQLLYVSERLVGHSSKKTDAACTQREQGDCGVKKPSEG